MPRMWQQWRAEIDLSLRDAELARDRRAERHLHEHELSQRRAAEPERRLERSLAWIARAAQAAASWVA